MVPFAKRLKQLRKAVGLNQSEIAEKLSVCQRQVSNYESGRELPPMKSLIILAALFNVTLDYLVGHKEDCDSLTGQKIEAVEQDLLDQYRNLSPADQARVRNFIDALAKT